MSVGKLEFGSKKIVKFKVDSRQALINDGKKYIEGFFKLKESITVDDLRAAIDTLKTAYNFDSLDRYDKDQACQEIRMILSTYLSSHSFKAKPNRQILKELLDSI